MVGKMLDKFSFGTRSLGTGARLFLFVLLVVLLAACSSWQPWAEPERPLAGGDPARGKAAIQDYGCGACHNIPGVPGANAFVGPPLDGWAERAYISGEYPNDPQMLIEWIQYPQAIAPGSAMPNMGVTEQDARDISAYLFTLTREDTFNFRLRWGADARD